ncbi:hypothetical protein HN873_057534, partial [Arachis hypogaea]
CTFEVFLAEIRPTPIRLALRLAPQSKPRKSFGCYERLRSQASVNVGREYWYLLHD